MESTVAPVINKYWLEDSFPFDLVPGFWDLEVAGMGYRGYGCAGGSTLQMLMRIGVPVFARTADSSPALSWRLDCSASPTCQLRATNAGSQPKVTEPIRNRGDKVGRNDPCPCGSGKKYKNCHMRQAV